MAGQKRVVRWLVAAAVVAALSGCASVPDAIKGTTPTPQQDLVRVMNAPQLYVGQEARFGGKVVSVQNQQGKTRLEIATVQLDDAARPGAGRSVARAYFCRRERLYRPGGFSRTAGYRGWPDRRRRRR